jgi:DNA mismatch repair protein MutS
MAGDGGRMGSDLEGETKTSNHAHDERGAPTPETPLMKQYGELKAQAGDALLFFRMGDFYELFGDDAVEAARLLEITLTSRDKGKANPLPMAGVPHHSAGGYLQRLLKAGKKVAIAEQTEDPALVKGSKAIVRREIVRFFTPAVNFEAEGSDSAYLATALPIPGTLQWRLACLEPSTGEVLVSGPLTENSLAESLGTLPVRHFLRIQHQLPEVARSALPPNVLLEEQSSTAFSAEQAEALLKKNYQLAQLEGFFEDETSTLALGTLAHYVSRSQRLSTLPHLQLPRALHAARSLKLGPRTAQHLDLVPGAEGSQSLLTLIQRTGSAAGARMLKRWLLAPLHSVSEIEARQEAVRQLAKRPENRNRFSRLFTELYDLERLVGRVTTGLANPRDSRAIGTTLQSLRGIGNLLSDLPRTCPPALSPVLQQLNQGLRTALESVQELQEEILSRQKEEAPLVARDGGIFRKGFHAELDRLLSLSEDGERFLIELETREREATQIPSLKVRYNRVFGYYIEVTTANLKNVPPHYQRKQTTVGGERFFTEELKKFEDEIVHASARQKALEQELFETLLEKVRERTRTLLQLAEHAAELDALVSLAALAEEAGWVFPTIDESQELFIENGRHPMVDAASRGAFVPNTTHLGESANRVLLLTGPNMGGKSTLLRQVALIVLLGQLGAPVPAKSARWGVFSQLFTRIGAHDAIARGQSTFMVEMSELAQILHQADSRALLILDEIGRGTSTYDGISVAWATLEWICRKIGARTLFATHYHELTKLPSELPTLANAHLAVETRPGSALRFLYKLQQGPTNESFGIHVAQLAGLPKSVTARAWEVLEELESHSAAQERLDSPQLSLFGLPNGPARNPEPSPSPGIPEHLLALEERVRSLKVDGLTPLQALNLLAELQSTLPPGPPGPPAS